MLTSRLMKRLTLKQSALRLLSILSIGLSVSCSGLKPFPTTKFVGYDEKLKICREYRLIDQENIKFEFVQNIPCPSVFGFTSADTPKVLNWIADAKDYVRNHCK